jgi:DNA-binding NtrC family response regulator
MAKFVLVVDDDAEMRRAVLAVLKDVCAVREAASGKEALRLMDERPSLAILDLSMPEIGGLDILSAMKAAQTAMPVLVLTGEHEIETAKKALDLGACAFLTKPFDVRFLRDEVRRLLFTPRENDEFGRPWRVST